ncbi:MAG: hypothetical protein HQK53_08595 [Oligoflexia bacterium]|nr:hypothetical protein [Oligoflexia bacterium]
MIDSDPAAIDQEHSPALVQHNKQIYLVEFLDGTKSVKTLQYTTDNSSIAFSHELRAAP